MLPIQFRLKSRKDFNDIFRRGKTVSNEVLVMKYEEAEGENLKIGFSVGLKFSKKASRRNKVKRWLREAARAIVKDIKPGHQIVFVINSKFPYEQMDYSLIRGKTENLLRKEKLLK